MDFESISKMELGQIVDYCIEWNKIQESTEEHKEKIRKRKATQADWDAFFGG